LLSDSSDSTFILAASEQDESYFVSYAVKVSKMKGWRLAGELATQLESFDDLKSELGNDIETSEKSLELKRTSRRIEIVTKENSKRKKY